MYSTTSTPENLLRVTSEQANVSIGWDSIGRRYPLVPLVRHFYITKTAAVEGWTFRTIFSHTHSLWRHNIHFKSGVCNETQPISVGFTQLVNSISQSECHHSFPLKYQSNVLTMDVCVLCVTVVWCVFTVPSSADTLCFLETSVQGKIFRLGSTNARQYPAMRQDISLAATDSSSNVMGLKWRKKIWVLK